MVAPTQEQIDEALNDMARRYRGEGAKHSERTNFDTIAAAYRAEKNRADEAEKLAYIGEHHFPDLTWKARHEETLALARLLERQYNELAEWDGLGSLIGRHEAERHALAKAEGR